MTVTEGVFRRVNETTGAVELVPVETEHTYIFMDGGVEYDVEIPLGAIAVDEMPVPRSRQGSYFRVGTTQTEATRIGRGCPR